MEAMALTSSVGRLAKFPGLVLVVEDIVVVVMAGLSIVSCGCKVRGERGRRCPAARSEVRLFMQQLQYLLHVIVALSGKQLTVCMRWSCTCLATQSLLEPGDAGCNKAVADRQRNQACVFKFSLVCCIYHLHHSMPHSLGHNVLHNNC